jgi:hypothetical protein
MTRQAANGLRVTNPPGLSMTCCAIRPYHGRDLGWIPHGVRAPASVFDRAFQSPDRPATTKLVVLPAPVLARTSLGTGPAHCQLDAM